MASQPELIHENEMNHNQGLVVGLEFTKTFLWYSFQVGS